MTTADIRGRFLWHDLMTTDRDAAGEFYPKVTGWESQPQDSSPNYSLWVSPEGMRGGATLLSPEAQSAGTPPHWLAYIGTPDIEATVEAAQRLGGRVIREITHIPSIGSYAVLADPQGATFAVYTPESADGATPSGFGEFSWHELATSDLDAAFSFYEELFGWEKLQSYDMGDMGPYVIFGKDGDQLGGMYTQPSDSSGGSGWLCYVSVPSADAAAQAVQAAGGEVLNGPMDVPGGDRIAQLRDPQGAAFAVHERRQAGAAKPAKSRKAAGAQGAEPAGREPAVATVKRSKPTRPAPLKSKAKAGSKAKAKAKAKAPARSKAPAKAAAKSKGRVAAKKAAAPKKKAAGKTAAARKAASRKAASKKKPAPARRKGSGRAAATKGSSRRSAAPARKKKAAARKRR